MHARRIEPEFLDQMSPAHPEAIRARADLARLNAFMGHPALVARVLRQAGWPGTDGIPHLVDLGGGDGAFLGMVAARLPSANGGVRATLVDRQPVRHDRAARALAAVGWQLGTVQADVFDWLAQACEPAPQIMVANLFLHHFTAAALRELLSRAAARTGMFVAVEPRRSHGCWLASCLVAGLGCNAVTRHDARLSVRAGFAGGELSECWPATGAWRLVERPAGLFSHLFVARAR